MSDRTDLIELLEGQAVYIGTCRRDNHLGRIKLLLREEILDRNARCLQILRAIQPRPPCQKCQESERQRQRLRLELEAARRQLDEIRRVCAYYEQEYPPEDVGLMLYELDKILDKGKH